MALLSGPGFDTDVRAAERVITQTVGLDPRPWFRLPFGNGVPDAGIHRRLEALGYRHVHWDVDAREWRKRLSARRVEEEIVSGTLARGDGAVVLAHSWPAVVLASMEAIVARLRAAGAEFVRVDALPDVPSGHRQA
jgi:peptidoglycan-N-acetylglucosamine deacetylase